MNEKLQKKWYLLDYLFIAHVLLFGTYRLLKATAIFNLATLKVLLFWPCLILIFFVLFFSVFLYRKSGDDWKKICS